MNLDKLEQHVKQIALLSEGDSPSPVKRKKKKEGPGDTDESFFPFDASVAPKNFAKT
jgi:hypothetical protein